MPDDHELRRAERLLFDIAVTLRRLPFDAEVRDLHLRSLRLKAAVERCKRGALEPSVLSELLADLVALDGLVGTVAAGHAKSGPVLRGSTAKGAAAPDPASATYRRRREAGCSPRRAT